MAKFISSKLFFYFSLFPKQKNKTQKKTKQQQIFKTFLLQLKLRPGEVYDPKVRVHEKIERKHKKKQFTNLSLFVLSLWL